jgi:Tfp pilus assembly protein PilO
MSSTNRLIVAIVAVAALTVAFWMLALSPKRKESSELAKEASQVQQSLAQHQVEVSQALEARRNFPVDYQQLVVLGKAVPGDDDTPSLLIQLNRVAKRSKVDFRDLALSPASGAGEAPPVEEAPAEAGATPVSATEAAASTLPLGATIGPAGLAVMPYTLTFKGDFFHLADFIQGLDSLVKTENEKVAVNGRLMTIDNFSLAADGTLGFPHLEATFNVTTYLTPPGQGTTAGATPTAPESAATPVSTTTGGTP